MNLEQIRKKYAAGEKLVMLTCYDASFSAVEHAAGVDLQLVGDSLGMVVQGHDSTLPVTLEQMAYHVANVRRGAKEAFVIGDLPFGTSQVSVEDTFRNSVKLMQAGANMVKLEGGEAMAATVRFHVERGVPVCGHLGLTPQSVNQIGGYRIQGKTDDAADVLLKDAKALQDAGVAMIVLELMPSAVAERATKALAVPTIGIGAGPHCSGQVLVLHDMLDVFPGKKPRFVKNYMQGSASIADAITRYVQDVKAGKFPGLEHQY